MQCAEWPPPRRKPGFSLAIPASILGVEHSLQLKTVKAGIIARAAALYRVDEVIVYRDRMVEPGDYRLMIKLLRYIVTPPHLKKALFPIDEDLRYAGVIPPLKTPAHEPPREPRPGALIDGLVLKCTGRECIIGLGALGRAIAPPGLRPGSLVTVKIEGFRAGRLLVTPAKPRCYWNLRVRRARGLASLIASEKRRGARILGTSRLGDCRPAILKKAVSGANRMLIVFGGPRGHVWDEAPRRMFDYILNLVPDQGTRTVRTEEALIASLATLDWAQRLPG